MYFIYLEKNNKKGYLHETDQGFELLEEVDGKPPQGSIYHLNIDDAHIELERLKLLAGADAEHLHVERRKWVTLQD